MMGRATGAEFGGVAYVSEMKETRKKYVAVLSTPYNLHIIIVDYCASDVAGDAGKAKEGNT